MNRTRDGYSRGHNSFHASWSSSMCCFQLSPERETLRNELLRSLEKELRILYLRCGLTRSARRSFIRHMIYYSLLFAATFIDVNLRKQART